MGKISPVSIKYIIHANLELTGVADRPDIIGAVFGQTEGLLGSDLELRELQKSGRIGRIDVKLETRGGKKLKVCSLGFDGPGPDCCPPDLNYCQPDRYECRPQK